MELDQLLLGIQINGYCVINDVIPVEKCASIRANLGAAAERQFTNGGRLVVEFFKIEHLCHSVYACLWAITNQ